MINKKQSSLFNLLCFICFIGLVGITVFQVLGLPVFNSNSSPVVQAETQYVVISSSATSGSTSSGTTSSGSGENSGSSFDLTPPFNLNTATSEQLQTLSGIGEVKASSIISMREALGGFSDLSQLLDVYGIGQATYEKIVPYLYLN